MRLSACLHIIGAAGKMVVPGFLLFVCFFAYGYLGKILDVF